LRSSAAARARFHSGVLRYRWYGIAFSSASRSAPTGLDPAVEPSNSPASVNAQMLLSGFTTKPSRLRLVSAHDSWWSIELTAPPPARGAADYSSLIDHQLSWALTNLRRDGLVVKPERSIWALTDAGLF